PRGSRRFQECPWRTAPAPTHNSARSLVSAASPKRPLSADRRSGAVPLPDGAHGRFLDSWEVPGMKRLLIALAVACAPASLWTATVPQDDKQSILIVSKRTGNAEIWLVNAQGKGARNLTRSTSENSYPCWSPDGKKI